MANMQHVTIEIRNGQVVDVYTNYGELRVIVVDHDRRTGYTLQAHNLPEGAPNERTP